MVLSEARRQRCPAAIAERVLQPTLFLHAEPTRRSVFDRALAVLRHPTLRGLLERAPGRSVFSAERAVPYVRIASQLYSLRRQIDGEPPTRRDPPHPTQRCAATSGGRCLTRQDKVMTTLIFIENVLGSGQVVKLTEDFGDYSVTRDLRPGENARLVVSAFKSISVEEVPMSAMVAAVANETRRLTTFAAPRTLERRCG